MKVALLLLCAAGLTIGQQGEERPGNFNVRFEPQAILQPSVKIPFQITVTDALNKPVIQANVTLQIETTDHQNVKVFKATMMSPGAYTALPVFPVAADYDVNVEVRRQNGRYIDMTARTKQYTVATAPPQ